MTTLKPMKTVQEAQREAAAVEYAEERRFWMDCCIAFSHCRGDGEICADEKLDEFRKRWRENGAGL